MNTTKPQVLLALLIGALAVPAITLKSTLLLADAIDSAPELNLAPYENYSLDDAKLSYGNRVIEWARRQHRRENGRPPSLTKVEKKLLDAMRVVSTVKDFSSDRFAKEQQERRSKFFETAYNNAIKDLISLKPPSQTIRRELKRGLALALEPTAVGDGTSAAQWSTLEGLKQQLNTELSQRMEYADEMLRVREGRARQDRAVVASIVAARRHDQEMRDDYQNLLNHRPNIVPIEPFGPTLKPECYSCQKDANPRLYFNPWIFDTPQPPRLPPKPTQRKDVQKAQPGTEPDLRLH